MIGESESDAVLIGRILNGESEAARLIVERHTPALRSVLLRAGVLPQDVDDLLQDTWVRVVRSASRYDPLQAFPGWLCAIAINRLRTRWSRQKVEAARTKPLEAASGAFAPEPSADSELVLAERAVALRSQILKLPKHLGDAILLRFFEELSEKEAARQLGVPPGTVKSRVHTAVRKLRSELERIFDA